MHPTEIPRVAWQAGKLVFFLPAIFFSPHWFVRRVCETLEQYLVPPTLLC